MARELIIGGQVFTYGQIDPFAILTEDGQELLTEDGQVLLIEAQGLTADDLATYLTADDGATILTVG